jgi:hypothetical protein
MSQEVALMPKALNKKEAMRRIIRPISICPALVSLKYW